MSSKKSIDRIFREKFKDFEETPDAHVWANIAARVEREKKDRRLFPIVLRYSGIAASMALMLMLGYYLRFLEEPTSTGITQQNNERIDTNTPPKGVQNQMIPVKEEVTQTPTQNRALHFKNVVLTDDISPIPETPSPGKEVEGGVVVSTQQPDFRDNPTGNNNELIPGDLDKKSLSDAIAENSEKDKDVVKTTPGERWSVNANAAPVYFNSLTGGSPIDGRFSDNSKTGVINMSYGVAVAYQLNDRLSVRSGVNKVQYGYLTNDIAFTPTLQARAIPTILYRGDIPTVFVTDQDVAVSSTELKSNLPVSYEGSMLQELGYIEVPLEVKYRLINKKVGVNVIGGVSSLFLTDNSISLQTDALTARVGTANNVNPINFSTNIGVGVDYKIAEKLLLNVEPMFKYQLQTFSENSNFRPYSLGVYTGLSFRF